MRVEASLNRSHEQVARGRGAAMSSAPRVVGAFALVALLVSSACTDAGGNESGGELAFDASMPSASDAGNPDEGLGTGTTFTDLYKDFFGPGGRASCAGNGACHGDASQPGAQASGGYVCPTGTGDAGTIVPALKTQCRATMISSMIITPGQKFSQAYMHSVLRKATHDATDENNMPRSPYTYTFSDASIARIAAWVESGAPDN